MGWKAIGMDGIADGKNNSWNVPSGILATILGCFVVYSALFSTGYWIYGEYFKAGITTSIVLILAFVLRRLWIKIRTQVL